MKTLPAYYVESWALWFVLRCRNKRVARREAVSEFGRGNVKDVRPATPEDVRAYRAQHGAPEETIDE